MTCKSSVASDMIQLYAKDSKSSSHVVTYSVHVYLISQQIKQSLPVASRLCNITENEQ